VVYCRLTVQRHLFGIPISAFYNISPFYKVGSRQLFNFQRYFSVNLTLLENNCDSKFVFTMTGCVTYKLRISVCRIVSSVGFLSVRSLSVREYHDRFPSVGISSEFSLLSSLSVRLIPSVGIFSLSLSSLSVRPIPSVGIFHYLFQVLLFSSLSCNVFPLSSAYYSGLSLRVLSRYSVVFVS